ncbi:MAG: hypothetical protein M3506_02915 [Chloroflexota bacterium]|nr:hypothetical protein [Chloroflexota bacterium]
MDMLDGYLTEAEAAAERAYRRAYHAEHTRLWEPNRSGDRERLLFWNELAHQVGKSARALALAAALPAAEQGTPWGDASSTDGLW